MTEEEEAGFTGANEKAPVPSMEPMIVKKSVFVFMVDELEYD
jgi:hypothetical protein